MDYSSFFCQAVAAFEADAGRNPFCSLQENLMTWKCNVGRTALQHRITQIAQAHPNASSDIITILELMENLFDSISVIYRKAAEKQHVTDDARRQEILVIIGAENYRNTMNGMTPEELRLHLQQHFDEIGIDPPSWGEVAEIACDTHLDSQNDPNGSIRREIKNALMNKL